MIIPDVHDLANLDPIWESPDIVIVPGGPGAVEFCQSAEVRELVRKQRDQNRWLACICAGPSVLIDATRDREVVHGNRWRCRVTSHPSVKQKFLDEGWDYVEDRVVVDDQVISSRGYV